MIAILVDPFTDGAVPIKCNLQVSGGYVNLKLGKEGWILQVPLTELQNVIGSEDLHG